MHPLIHVKKGTPVLLVALITVRAPTTPPLVHALFGNSTGSNNIALGRNAGNNLTIGNNNIDIGTGETAGESNTIRIGSAQTRTLSKVLAERSFPALQSLSTLQANSESPHRQGVSRMRLSDE